MKTSRGRILTLAGIIALACVFAFWDFYRSPRLIPQKNLSQKNSSLQTNHPSSSHNFTLRAAAMTEQQKNELAKKFEEKFQPAVRKWFLEHLHKSYSVLGV